MTPDSLGTSWGEVVFCLALVMFGLLLFSYVPSHETRDLPMSRQIAGMEIIAGQHLDRPSPKTQARVSGVRAVSLITQLTPAHNIQRDVLLCGIFMAPVSA